MIDYTVFILNKEINKLKEIKETLIEYLDPSCIDNEKIKEIDLKVLELKNNIDYITEFRK